MRFQLVLSAALVLLLAACVPSPTATPPLATPFPTLPPFPTDAPLPTPTSTSVPFTHLTLGSTVAITPVSTVQSTPKVTATATPLFPTVGAFLALPLANQPLGPLVQVFPSDESGTVSVNQSISFGVLATANTGLGRVELYQEKKLVSSVTVPTPPPRLFSGVLKWQPTQAGPQRLQIIAFDCNGNVSAPVEFAYDVVADNHAPTALITNFVGQIERQVGAPVPLQGIATDDVAVTRVDLYVDDLLYTYLAPETSQGLSPFPVNLTWTPSTSGLHKLYLRAHDNQDQTGDSPILLVDALAPQPPALTVRYERDQVVADDALLVYTLALSPNNITRVELWADDQLAQVVDLPTPEGQPLVDTSLVWQSASVAGDHTLFVRVYDHAGLSASTTRQVIHVLPAGSRLPTATLAPPGPLPSSTAPAPSPTPGLIVPPPPTIAVSTAQDPTALQLPGPLRIRLQAHGSAELGQVELWARYNGETTPELLMADSMSGSTDKSLDFDWLPSQPGIASLYARIVDHLGQEGQSAPLTVYLIPAPAPLATPVFTTLRPRWTATIPTSKFDITFVQIGRALRGVLINTPLNSGPFVGSIIGGNLVGDRLSFSVEFDSAEARPRALDFDCLVNGTGDQLSCNYQDEAGNRERDNDAIERGAVGSQ